MGEVNKRKLKNEVQRKSTRDKIIKQIRESVDKHLLYEDELITILAYVEEELRNYGLRFPDLPQ